MPKFKRLLKKRTAVKRINGRLDRDFKFDKHFIRGLDKMNSMVSIAFLLQLAFAHVKLIKTKESKHLESWEPKRKNG